MEHVSHIFSTVREKIVYARLTTMTFVCAVNIYASGAQSNLEGSSTFKSHSWFTVITT